MEIIQWKVQQVQGKTSVLASKVAYLVLVCGIKPSKIIITSFSKSSARDMKDRFYNIYGDVIKENIVFSTIHSFAYSIIRTYERMANIKYTIIEDSKNVDKNKIIKDIFKKRNGRSAEEEEIQELIGYITYIRNLMIYYNDLDDYKDMFDIPNFKDIYKDYSEFLNKNKYLDYDCLLTMAHHILVKYPKIRTMYQNKYNYYLNDESQDNSKIQNQIIKILAKDKKVCFVGDTDQCIYGWRGVDFQEFSNFPSLFKNANVLVMGQNFRSTPNIVNLANYFIKKNKNRYDKHIYTNNHVGEDVIIGTVIDEHSQSDYIVREIKRSKRNFKEYAILYRNNISAVAIMDKLHKSNIPFYIKDEVTSLSNNYIVKDIINFVKVAMDPYDLEAFKRVYYKCNFYVKKDIIYNLKLINDNDIFDTLYMEKELSSYMQERCLDMKEKFRMLSKLHPSRVIDYIQNELNYREYLEAHVLGENGVEKADNILATLKVLFTSIDNINDIKYKLKMLSNLMIESKKNLGGNVVTLTTFHSSKGLEWDEVFIDTHAIPSISAINNAKLGNMVQMEEEIRAFFVAITRPRKKLHIIQVLTNNCQNVTPSPFIDDIKTIIKSNEYKRSINKNKAI